MIRPGFQKIHERQHFGRKVALLGATTNSNSEET